MRQKTLNAKNKKIKYHRTDTVKIKTAVNKVERPPDARNKYSYKKKTKNAKTQDSRKTPEFFPIQKKYETKKRDATGSEKTRNLPRNTHAIFGERKVGDLAQWKPWKKIYVRRKYDKEMKQQGCTESERSPG